MTTRSTLTLGLQMWKLECREVNSLAEVYKPDLEPGGPNFKEQPELTYHLFHPNACTWPMLETLVQSESSWDSPRTLFQVKC